MAAFANSYISSGQREMTGIYYKNLERHLKQCNDSGEHVLPKADRDDKTVKILHSLATSLKMCKPDKKYCNDVSSRRGAVVSCLSSGAWTVVSAALQCLHCLTLHYVSTDASTLVAECTDSIAELQQTMTCFLQNKAQTTCAAHGEMVYWALRVTRNLVLCSPNTLLHTTFITAVRPYMFYNVAAYKSAVQSGRYNQSLGVALALTDLPDHTPEAMQSSESEPNTQHRVNYSNRNRRKRLRRKKLHPVSDGRSPGSSPVPGFSCTNPSTSHGRGRFDSLLDSSSNARHASMPRVPVAPGPEDLNSISLKPQWAIKPSPNKSDVQIKSNQERFDKKDTSRNNNLGQASKRSIIISETGQNQLLNEHSEAATTNEIKTCPTHKIETSEVHLRPNNSGLMKCQISKNEAHHIDSSRGSHSDTGNDSESNEEETSEDEVRDSLHHSKFVQPAGVRLVALDTVNTFVSLCESKNKLSLWVPLLCQSPSVLVSLQSDPHSSVRSTALSVLSSLLTDSRQHLSNASDCERGAYSSLCYQLGTNIREVHRVLGQVLLTETNTDSIVRTLKTMELLLDNVPYAKLKPGLLSSVVRAVKPYVSHSEAVVRANALSVFVYLLLVKPTLPELRQLLLSYAAPVGDTEALARAKGIPLPEETVEGSHENSMLTSSDDAEEYLEEDEDFIEDFGQLDVNNSSCIDTLADGKDKRAGQCRRSTVGWLVGQCVDCLLPSPAASRGIYVQVQLQSLKVLNALISEHFDLVYKRLPVIQKIISDGCKECVRSCSLSHGQQEGHTDWVVVEHVYPLLGSLLFLLKKESEAIVEGSVSDKGDVDGSQVSSSIHTVTSTKVSSSVAALSNAKQSSINWPQLSASVWVWALQGPLSELLMLPVADEYIKGGRRASVEPSANSIWWAENLHNAGEVGDMARRQLVAAANVLTLFTPTAVESIGEQLLTATLRAVLWLIRHPLGELSVWGVRAAGVLCSLAEVQRCSLGLQLVKGAVDAATDLLLTSAADEKKKTTILHDQSWKKDIETMFSSALNKDDDALQTTVNKHRLVAVSALANISASLKHYSVYFRDGELLPLSSVEKLLEAAILSCKDKSRIRPHGVRCLGSSIGWLRGSANESSEVVSVWYALNPNLCERALHTLSDCCSTGSNMKMRWNACHALGHLLHSSLPIGGSQSWRSPVLAILCSLVTSFHNYKVRIQACGALCSQPSRELYESPHYNGAWRALLAAANSTQNVTDYLEMRHRDDLICQVTQGVWHLSSLLLVSDCEWLLTEVLHNHYSLLALLQRRTQSILPPHCWAGAAQAEKRVSYLLESCDALTEGQQECLCQLLKLFSETELVIDS